MLSISEIERESGISRDTLRVWEKRYGFPAPHRNQRGERIYRQEQLERLRLIKQLLDRGMRPRNLVRLNDGQLLSLTQQHHPAASSALEAESLLGLLADGNRHQLRVQLKRLLDEYGLRFFLVEVLTPMNRMVGDAWFSGRIGVFDEHYYAEQVRSLLLARLDAFAPPPGSPRALLTTLPGEQHGIGLLMAACILTLEGAAVDLLGVQTPPEEIARGAAEGVTIVGISCSGYLGRRLVAAQLVRLRKLLPEQTVLWVGGSGIAQLPALPRGIRLFHSLEQISEALPLITSPEQRVRP
jgi:DNA-binding transcriptional MerR regulator/methylmalonyl-CoA mutase cobalamin-binding subunit